MNRELEYRELGTGNQLIIALLVVIAHSCDASNAAEIHIAVRERDRAQVEILLEQDLSQLDARDKDQFTPLHRAVQYGDREMVALLLEYGANASTFSYSSDTPLLNAAQRRDKAILHLLEASGARWDVISAARIGDVGRLRKLIEADPDRVNQRDKNYQQTPLHWTISLGHFQAAQFLVEHGADANAPNFNNFTPFHKAITSGRRQFVEFFLDHGADINRPGDGEIGRSPLHMAIKLPNDVDICTLLLERGANVNAQNIGGRTPLHDAAWSGNSESIAILLQHGAAICIQSKQGMTALDHGVIAGRLDVVELLLESGALEDCDQGEDKRILDLTEHISSDDKRQEMMELLRRFGLKK